MAKLTLTIKNPLGSGVTLKTAQLRNVTTKIDYFPHLIENEAPSLLTEPYPNHNNFTTFDYAADEFAVAPGDSKVLTYYLPCHLLGKSQSSSEKRKGDFAPDYATFVEIYGVSEDGSKYSRYRFYLGDNMTNDYNIRPNYHYTLPLTFNKIGNPQNDSRVELVDAILQEPDANSYIVNPLPGDDQRMYCIPVAWRINTFWQNEMDAGHIASSTAYTIMSDNQWSADIIWQTSDEQMIEFYNADGTITDKEGRVSPVYYGQTALRFKPKKGAEGNVLVGVYRTDQPNASDPTKREYSWSWHLWITDYNPDECRNQNWDGRYKYVLSNGSGEVHRYKGTLWDADDAIYHNKWIMDRYLGALNNKRGDFSYMYMSYQAGRVNPIPNMNRITAFYYDSTKENLLNLSKSSKESYGLSLAYIINHPQYRYVDSNTWTVYPGNIYYQNLWDDPNWSKEIQGVATKKSFFDPCPPGWCIPEKDVWSGVISSAICFLGQGYQINIDGIKTSDNTAFYNYSGNTNGGTGEGYIGTTPGILKTYTSTPSSRSQMYVLGNRLTGRFEINGGPDPAYRFNLNTIRPVQCDDPYIK